MFKKFLKNGLLLFTILIMTVFTSGCLKLNTIITIDKYGNATIEDYSMVSDEMFPMAEDGLNEKINKINNLGNKNVSAEIISENGNSGAKITFNVHDILNNDIKYPFETKYSQFDYIKSNLESGRFIDVYRKFFKTYYYIDLSINFKGDPVSTASFSINIPGFAKVLEHNATSVDKDFNTYTWKKKDSEMYIFLTFSTWNMFNVILFSIGCILILAIIVFFIILFAKNNSTNNIK